MVGLSIADSKVKRNLLEAASSLLHWRAHTGMDLSLSFLSSWLLIAYLYYWKLYEFHKNKEQGEGLCRIPIIFIKKFGIARSTFITIFKETFDNFGSKKRKWFLCQDRMLTKGTRNAYETYIGSQKRTYVHVCNGFQPAPNKSLTQRFYIKNSFKKPLK